MGMGSAATAASEAGEPWRNGIDRGRAGKRLGACPRITWS
jgi:hypothetical protein